jgi:molybdenum cofactor synthesis domain-containing protein
MPLRVGVLTVSDRVSRGEMEDEGGPAVERSLPSDWQVAARAVVPDERERIALTLRQWTDRDRLDVIFTTGGTGLGPRDVTPDATIEVAGRLVPGMAEAMRAAGMSDTPAAMLSRAVVAVRSTTLIVNLPGSPPAAADSVHVVAPVLEHAVATIHGGRHGHASSSESR